MTDRPTSIPDLLAGHGIAHKGGLTAGRQLRLICPSCHGGRSKEQSLAVRIDEDGAGATWQCKRGTCGFVGGERLHSTDGITRAAPRQEQRPIRTPPQIVREDRPPALYAWAAARGITEDTVDAFGLYIAMHWFPPPIDRERPAIVFPYRYRGEVVNRKFRPPEKSPQMAEKDALPTLYNVTAIESADWVWWVEGEPDCLAMHEAGYTAVVTLKDGADGVLRDEDDPRREDDRRFAALATHADLLGQIKRFVLAGDMDQPGTVLREELARRLGRHRCWLVTWPEGCKDAGDTLKQHGADGVRRAVDAALPYPIEGVQTLRPGTLAALRAAPPPPVMSTGCAATDAILKLPAEGRLVIVTGLPNAGKSVWVSWVMIHTCVAHQRRWAVFSPEMQPWEHYAALLAQTFIGVPFWATRERAGMTDDQVEHANLWLAQHLTFLVSDAEAEPPTLDWIFERAAMLVLRDGVTDLLIDPWNEVEHARGQMSETEYVGRSLQRCKSFGNRYGVNVWIVAHPAKQVAAKPGGAIPAPGPYEISGSSNWANKGDLILTVHTPADLTEIHVMKARFRRFGRKGNKATLDFDPATGRYKSPSSAPSGQAIFEDMTP